MRESKHLKYKNIWIIQTHWLWDALVFLPIIKKIREKFPNSNIHVYTWTDFWKEIYKNIDYIDEVIELDNSSSILNKFKLVFKYFKKYDIFIDTLWWDKYTCLISNLFWKNSMGFKSIWKYKINIIWENPDDFIFVQHNKILQYLDIEAKHFTWEFPLRQSDLNSLTDKISLPKNKFACFHPSSKRWFTSKRLDEKQINSIIDYLVNKLWFSVFLIWTKADDEVYKNIKERKWLIKVHDKWLSIWETAHLIDKSDIYIWTNSWPMRIAATLNKNSVIINWPSMKCRVPPEEYFPAIVNIKPVISCDNIQCNKEICKLNKKWPWLCIKNIDIDEVINLINSIINNKS